MRFASLVLALTLGTGCISGFDTKPYNITLGPTVFTPEEKAIIFFGAVAAVLLGKVAYGMIPR